MSNEPWLFITVDLKTSEYTVHLTPDIYAVPSCIGYWAHFPTAIVGAVCFGTYDPNWATVSSNWYSTERTAEACLIHPSHNVVAYLLARNCHHAHLLNLIEGFDQYILRPCRHCGDNDDIRSVLMSIQ